MNRQRTGLGEDAVAELHDAFDRSFAEAPARAAQTEDLLAVTCGGAPYALRLREVAALLSDVRVTPVPSPIPEFLGIAGVRGEILPVYDLGAMLGQPADASARWVVVTAAARLGLAVGRLDGHRRLSEDALASDAAAVNAGRHLQGVVRLEGQIRPIVALASVLESIAHRVRAEDRKGATDR